MGLQPGAFSPDQSCLTDEIHASTIRDVLYLRLLYFISPSQASFRAYGINSVQDHVLMIPTMGVPLLIQASSKVKRVSHMITDPQTSKLCCLPAATSDSTLRCMSPKKDCPALGWMPDTFQTHWKEKVTSLYTRVGNADKFADAHQCESPYYPTCVGYSAIYAAHDMTWLKRAYIAY